MYDFLQQSTAPGDLGQIIARGFPSRFFPGAFFTSRLFPVRFPFFGFPFARFPFAYPQPYPYPYPYPQPVPAPAAITVELRYDGATSGPIASTDAALAAALSMLNASTGATYVTVTRDGVTVLTKSVDAAVIQSALGALRAAPAAYPPYPAPPAYPYGYPYYPSFPYAGYPYSPFAGYRGLVLGAPEQTGEVAAPEQQGAVGEVGEPPPPDARH
jgi:hypothetical protein